MAAQDLAAALQRVEAVLLRRPETGLHDDAPAIARWDGGTRIITSHENGSQIHSDMPSELGGTGDKITPGWMFRAGIAACAATTIAITAAKAGVALKTLDVQTHSRTDTRGMLGMAVSDGNGVHAAPQDLQLIVRISALGCSQEQLKALVNEALRCSPIPCAVQAALPLALHIEVEAE